MLAFPVVVQTISETIMQLDRLRHGRPARRDRARRDRLRGHLDLDAASCRSPAPRQGVQAFVSRHDGANEQQLCGPWIWQAVWLLVPAHDAVDVRGRARLPALSLRSVPRRSCERGGRVRLRAPAGGPGRRRELRADRASSAASATRARRSSRSLGGIAVNVALAYALIFGELGLAAGRRRRARAIAQSAGSWTILALLTFAALRRRGARALPHAAASAASARRCCASCAPARRSAASGCST